jgi:hypothetical protein
MIEYVSLVSFRAVNVYQKPNASLVLWATCLEQSASANVRVDTMPIPLKQFVMSVQIGASPVYP